MAKNILMVVSAADSLTMRDGSDHPTGYWAEELVVSHRTLLDAGHTVHIATPGGKKPTVDEVSLAAESAGGQDRADSFRRYIDSLDAELSNPLVLADVDASAYDAVVMPGGHGPMADLYQDADLGRLLTAVNTYKGATTGFLSYGAELWEIASARRVLATRSSNCGVVPRVAPQMAMITTRSSVWTKYRW